MYLSRLVLDPRQRTVQHDLADCHALHRTVMSAFPADAVPSDTRAHLGILFRPDIDARTGAIILLVQSSEQPDWSPLVRADCLVPPDFGDKNPACKRLDDLYRQLASGQVLRFRLRANPTKRLTTTAGADGQRPPGKRIELRDEAAQLAWLERKGTSGGFGLLHVRIAPAVPNVTASAVQPVVGFRQRVGEDGQTAPRQKLTFGAVVFDGLLRITDRELFQQTLRQGIGSGKAYGFGLLSIAPTPMA